MNVRLKDFGKTGRKVSEVGMGTYYDPLWVATAFLGWRRGAKEKVDAIKSGLDVGMTLVDTAEIYGSEPLVAEAIQGWRRDELFLATKVWSNHLHRDALVRSFHRSLRRLGTSYIDLYQVHWPNPGVPIEETMAAMEELVGEGKLNHVGVSNFDHRQIEDARSALPRTELTSVQLDYSLIHRNPERDILSYCDREGIALLAYYPLGHGRLTSDPRLDAASAKHAKTRAQVALQWLARKDNVFPIPRASRRDHVMEDARASDWALPDLDVLELETTFR